jgi:hypothetical protein
MALPVHRFRPDGRIIPDWSDDSATVWRCPAGTIWTAAWRVAAPGGMLSLPAGAPEAQGLRRAPPRKDVPALAHPDPARSRPWRCPTHLAPPSPPSPIPGVGGGLAHTPSRAAAGDGTLV